jgi:uncharacterized protein
VSLYRSYSAYLRERYGMPARRVAVDGGFGCPHRARGVAGGGCIYCVSGGSGAAAGDPAGIPLEEQVDAGVVRASARGPAALLLYFQAYSGTNAPPERLRTAYDTALSRADFRALIVATRPDCVDRERSDLLASYLRPGRDVWVELGLQSAHDRTLRLTNRAHSVADFRAAFDLLRSRGLHVGVHLIFGLPGESHEDILATARYVGALRPHGVKIHNLHVCRATPLAELFLRGEVTAPTVETHLRYVAESLEFLPAQTVILRLTTDTPVQQRLAPRRFCDKAAFAGRLSELMRREGRRQGARFDPEAATPPAG